MWLVVIFCFYFFNIINAIDGHEKLGRCVKGFTVDVNYYLNEMEGIWFPQYRPKDPHNKEYTCHTLYEQVDKTDGKYELVVDSFLTINNTADREPHTVSYRSGNKRGILVDTEDVHGFGEYHIYNFILKKTKDFRVRYVCTDFENSVTKYPVVYIETRNMTPKLNTINEAVEVIRRSGLKVVLDKIKQKNCTRPISYKGYNEDV